MPRTQAFLNFLIEICSLCLMSLDLFIYFPSKAKRGRYRVESHWEKQGRRSCFVPPTRSGVSVKSQEKVLEVVFLTLKVNLLFQCKYFNGQDRSRRKLERTWRGHWESINVVHKINQKEQKKLACRKMCTTTSTDKLAGGEMIIVFPKTEHYNMRCSFNHKWIFLPAWFCHQSLPGCYLHAPSFKEAVTHSGHRRWSYRKRKDLSLRCNFVASVKHWLRWIVLLRS